MYPNCILKCNLQRTNILQHTELFLNILFLNDCSSVYSIQYILYIFLILHVNIRHIKLKIKYRYIFKFVPMCSLDESSYFLFGIRTQILGQNLISLSLYYVGFLLCFQWNRQRKSVAYGHPRVHVFLLQRTQTRLHSPYFPTPKCIHYMTDDIREASWRWRQEHTQLASYPFKS